MKAIINPHTVLLFVLCCLSLACERQEFLIIDEPVVDVIDLVGEDLRIEGNIDGEAFAIIREGNAQRNFPYNEEGSFRPFFGTDFQFSYPGQETEASIQFGIIKNEDSTLPEVIQVGTYLDWYDFSGTAVEGQVIVRNLTFNGREDMTHQFYANSNPENYLEITAITPLEMDESLAATYPGQLYKVEGFLAVDIDPRDNSDDTPRLTIDYFSALFYDE